MYDLYNEVNGIFFRPLIPLYAEEKNIYLHAHLLPFLLKILFSLYIILTILI